MPAFMCWTWKTTMGVDEAHCTQPLVVCHYNSLWDPCVQAWRAAHFHVILDGHLPFGKVGKIMLLVLSIQYLFARTFFKNCRYMIRISNMSLPDCGTYNVRSIKRCTGICHDLWKAAWKQRNKYLERSALSYWTYSYVVIRLLGMVLRVSMSSLSFRGFPKLLIAS
jgi:hypothetical protein